MSRVWAQGNEILRCQNDTSKIAADNQCPCFGPALKCGNETVSVPDVFIVDAIQDGVVNCCGSGEGGEGTMLMQRASEDFVRGCLDSATFDYEAGAVYLGQTVEKDPLHLSRLQANGQDFCSFQWGMFYICCHTDSEWTLRLEMANTSIFPAPTEFCDYLALCFNDACDVPSFPVTCDAGVTLNAWSVFEHNEPLATDFLSFDKTYDEEFPAITSFSAGPSGGLSNCDWRSVTGRHPILRITAG